MRKYNIKVELNYTGNFVDYNGKYGTYPYCTYPDDTVDRIISGFDCMAYITCPKGTAGVYLQPEIDADDFKCCVLQGNWSCDYMTLFEKVDGNGFETPSGEDVDITDEVVKYLYDEDVYYNGFYQKPCWSLKCEICDKIVDIINDNLESYIKEMGYEEIDDMDI